MLMEARDKDSGAAMSEAQLIDEVMTLIVAGHETTASGLNWIWYLLSEHPEVDARLHAEIDATPDVPAPSLAQMEALTYTQQVINEALRLYPPGWLLSAADASKRTCFAGMTVAAGTKVMLPMYLLHRHPAVLELILKASGRALRARARSRAAALCVHALCRWAPALHRRNLRPLRNAHTPVQGGAPLSPDPCPGPAAGT